MVIQQDNTRKNIQNFFIWLIPIIIVSKIVRWTIMYAKLVDMSIGNGIADRINHGEYKMFMVSGLSEMSNASSVAEYNTGFLFNAINIFGCETIATWEIYISIIYNIILIYFIKDFYRRTPNAGRWENLFVYTGVAILNIFCFCLSKEPYQMLFFFLMALAIRSGKGYQMKSILLSGAILITVLLSRKYYGLVLVYYFILQYVVRYLFDSVDLHSKNGKKKLFVNIIITAAIIGVCYFFMLSFLSSANEDTYEEMVAANYRDMDRQGVAASEIVPIFEKGNPLFMAADYVIKIFRLMFPIELLIKGKATYVFFIFFQALLAMSISNAFINRKAAKKKPVEEDEDEDDEDEDEVESDDENIEEDPEEEDDDEDENEEDEEESEEDEEEELDIVAMQKAEDRRDTRTAALYLYLAFLLCSAAFEPDFGSWIRHEGITLPILLLIL